MTLLSGFSPNGKTQRDIKLAPRLVPPVVFAQLQFDISKSLTRSRKRWNLIEKNFKTSIPYVEHPNENDFVYCQNWHWTDSLRVHLFISFCVLQYNVYSPKISNMT